MTTRADRGSGVRASTHKAGRTLQGLDVAPELRNPGSPGRDGFGYLTQWLLSFARWARSRSKNSYKRVSDKVQCVYKFLPATSSRAASCSGYGQISPKP